MAEAEITGFHSESQRAATLGAAERLRDGAITSLMQLMEGPDLQDAPSRVIPDPGDFHFGKVFLNALPQIVPSTGETVYETLMNGHILQAQDTAGADIPEFSLDIDGDRITVTHGRIIQELYRGGRVRLSMPDPVWQGLLNISTAVVEVRRLEDRAAVSRMVDTGPERFDGASELFRLFKEIIATQNRGDGFSDLDVYIVSRLVSENDTQGAEILLRKVPKTYAGQVRRIALQIGKKKPPGKYDAEQDRIRFSFHERRNLDDAITWFVTLAKSAVNPVLQERIMGTIYDQMDQYRFFEVNLVGHRKPERDSFVLYLKALIPATF